MLPIITPVPQHVTDREIERIHREVLEKLRSKSVEYDSYRLLPQRGKFIRQNIPMILSDLEANFSCGNAKQDFRHDFDGNLRTLSKNFDRIRASSFGYDVNRLTFDDQSDDPFSECTAEFWFNAGEVHKNSLRITHTFSRILVSYHLMQRVYERHIAREKMIEPLLPYIRDWMKIHLVLESVRRRVYSDRSFYLPMGDHLVGARRTKTNPYYSNHWDRHFKVKEVSIDGDVHTPWYTSDYSVRATTIIEYNELHPEQEWCRNVLTLWLGKHKTFLDDLLHRVHLEKIRRDDIWAPEIREVQDDLVKIFNHPTWLKGNRTSKAGYFTRPSIMDHMENVAEEY